MAGFQRPLLEHNRGNSHRQHSEWFSGLFSSSVQPDNAGVWSDKAIVGTKEFSWLLRFSIGACHVGQRLCRKTIDGNTREVADAEDYDIITYHT